MKTKLKVIIPIGIALVIIALAFVFIRFDSNDEFDFSAAVKTAYEYLTEQKFEQAVAEFEKIIKIDPRNAEAYIGIAEAYEAMGDIEKAVEWLEKGYEATGDESIKAMLDRLLDDMQGEVSEIVTSVSEEVTTEETTEETTTTAEEYTSEELTEVLKLLIENPDAEIEQSKLDAIKYVSIVGGNYVREGHIKTNVEQTYWIDYETGETYLVSEGNRTDVVIGTLSNAAFLERCNNLTELTIAENPIDVSTLSGLGNLSQIAIPTCNV